MRLFIATSVLLFGFSTNVAAETPEPVKCFENAPRVLGQEFKVALCAATKNAEATIECYEEAPRTLALPDRVRLCAAEPAIIPLTRATRQNAASAKQHEPMKQED